MQHDFTTTMVSPDTDHALAKPITVAEAANEAAADHVFDDYTGRKAENTLRAQRANLQTFCEYAAAIVSETLPNDDNERYKLLHDRAQEKMSRPESWQGISWGIVEGFAKWLLREGYAISTVNLKLSSIKVYCRLAMKAGVIDAQDYALIKAVSGYSDKEGKRVNERRGHTRIGRKKAEHVSLTVEDANALKFNPDTPQGRRDTVLMCLLLDHGLRVSEVEPLEVTDFDMKERKFTVYRSKVDKTQTLRMKRHTYDAVKAYMDAGDAPAMGQLLRRSRKGGKAGTASGKLTTAGMSVRAIRARVKTLGKDIGIDNLSPHDCRHYWATRAADAGTDPFALRDAGGWSSLAMPDRYVESAAIANEREKGGTFA